MSGEAVGIPVLLVALPVGAVVVGAGVVAATVLVPGSLAVRLVKAFVDGRVQAAEREAVEERENTAAWRDHQKQQNEVQEKQARLFCAFAASTELLAACQLHERARRLIPAGDATDRTKCPRKDDVRASQLLDDLSAILNGLEDAFKMIKDSPYPTLISYRNQLQQRTQQGERLYWEEVVTFRNLITSTLNECRLTAEKAAARQAEFTTRTRTMLERAKVHTSLAPTASLKAEMKIFTDKLSDALRTDHISASQLDTFERRSAMLAVDVAQAVDALGLRVILAEAVTRHLGDLGYTMIEAFPNVESPSQPLQARLRVPGGEQVFVTLHANGKIAFRLAHEKGEGMAAALAEFLPQYRRQEARWCKDLKELFRQLIKDGFSYQVSFEREVPETAVQFVTIETTDELISADDQERARRQQFGQLKKKRTLSS